MRGAPWIAAALAMLAPAAGAGQQRIETRGTIAHQRAGTGFPERVGEFRRSNATRFDEAGVNLAASYNLIRPEGRLVVSVYIYPADSFRQETRSAETDPVALCREEFADVRRAIEQTQQDEVALEAGQAAALPGTDPRLSHRALYRFHTRFGDSVREVRSEARLYCGIGGGWQVKYRATAPADLDVDSAIDSFIRAGPWPGRAPPPSPDEVA